LYSIWKRELPEIRRKEATMLQDALFVPDRHLRDKAAALPAAALAHAVALTLLITLPLLRVGELPKVDISDVIVVPALPATPLPPPKARSGDPGARMVRKRVPIVSPGIRLAAPVDIPVGIVAEESLGTGGAEFGIPGGVDYGGAGGDVPANLLGAALYDLVGDVEPVAIRAVGESRAPKLVRRVEPDYPEIARQARVEGVIVLEATTDVYGRVTAVRVLRSIPLLDEAAVAAVRQWIYEPLMINGRPRPVTFTVTVRFVLK
jgi:protein TonB